MIEDSQHNPFSAFKATALTPDEKASLRANVRGFMSLHRPRRWYGWFAHHVVATLTLILVLGGGSVLWAADSAEPDSALYPVRTSVNDQVRIVAAGDELAQIERELELLGTYFSEEEALVERELTL